MTLSAEKLSKTALFTAAAAALHVAESFLPALPFIPWCKPGFANIVSFAAIFFIGGGYGFAVLILRCLIGALYGSVYSLAYSLAGGLVSYTFSLIAVKKIMPRISVTAICVAAAVLHNLTQGAVAAVVVKADLFYLIPYLTLAGVFTGVISGILAGCLINNFRRRSAGGIYGRK